MYCNAACKKRHRHKHKKDCEEHLRLAAEHAAKVHDEKLFKQPRPQLDDCPICFIRMPSITKAQAYYSCCGKVICSGCIHAAMIRNGGRHGLCPFCRTTAPESREEFIKRYKKRMELNDAEAIRSMGRFHADGSHGYPQNYVKALELYHRAADLGHAVAYFNIGFSYQVGRGVESDTKKAIHYYELGAVKGDVNARFALGMLEGEEGSLDRALKHYMIAIEGGDKDSLQGIKQFYSDGYATKEVYTEALRSYQEYLDEIKSEQRDAAAAANADWKYY